MGDRTENSNKILAIKIVASNNKEAVKELIELLDNKQLQNDAIKTLYEIGSKNSILITDYFDDFRKLWYSKNNRLQWGGVCCIYCLVKGNEKKIFNYLPELIDVADKGTVITRDYLMKIMTQLYINLSQKNDLYYLINGQILKAPENQMDTYAENFGLALKPRHKYLFLQTLQVRLKNIETVTKLNRIKLLIKKISKP